MINVQICVAIDIRAGVFFIPFMVLIWKEDIYLFGHLIPFQLVYIIDKREIWLNPKLIWKTKIKYIKVTNYMSAYMNNTFIIHLYDIMRSKWLVVIITASNLKNNLKNNQYIFIAIFWWHVTRREKNCSLMQVLNWCLIITLYVIPFSY